MQHMQSAAAYGGIQSHGKYKLPFFLYLESLHFMILSKGITNKIMEMLYNGSIKSSDEL